MIETRHRWDCDQREAVGIQQTLRRRLVLEDALPGVVRTVAGADVSYDRGSDRFFAAAVVLTYPDLVVREEAHAVGRVTFPYIPGLLSFREGPVMLAALDRLARPPDLILFDGQGIAHPRGIGLASHLGLWLDLPTIGCAKTRLCGTFDPVGEAPGSRSELRMDGRVVGTVLRTRRRTNPLFVSPGHRIAVETAAAVVLACCRNYRLPEPTRRAHLLVNRLRREA
ncbi:MAG TPA: deoxyribonuclease V [Syntrophales bacterium]|nr:deoxyribonuclease V [Syntrophales bacterium]